MSKKATADRMKRARDELCAVLGYGDDPDALTVDQNMRVDLVLALKVALDDMRAALFRGETVDTGEMRDIASTLERYLPKQAQPEPVEPGEVDPREKLKDIVRRYWEAKEASRSDQGLSPRVHDLESAQARIDDLEAELVRLRGAQPHALPSPEVEKTITPSIGDITPPGEVGEFYVGKQPLTPDDIKAMRPKPTIEHEVGPKPGTDANGRVIPPQAKPGDVTKAQAARVNADYATVHRIMTAPSRVTGEPQPSSPMTAYGDSGFYWQGAKGRAW